MAIDGFGKLRARKAADEKAPTPLNEVAVAPEPANELALRVGAAPAGGALAAIIDVDDGEPGAIFPIIQQKGGNGGGALAPVKSVPQAIADNLPSGVRPIKCVFVGYRVEAAAWPVGYDQKKADDDGKPAWSCAVGQNNTVDAELVAEAASRYQYTSRAAKPAWDYAASGIGHIRPNIAVLVYLPETQQLVVVQSALHFASLAGTSRNLGKLLDPKTGEIAQVPMLIRTVSTPKTINGNQVTEHTLDFEPQLTPDGGAWLKSFEAFRAALLQAPEQLALARTWLHGEDKPITDDIRQILDKAARFRPQA